MNEPPASRSDGVWKSVFAGAFVGWLLCVVLNVIAFTSNGEPRGDLRGYLTMGALVVDQVAVWLAPGQSFTILMGTAMALSAAARATSRAAA
jgi:hypothetical protein